MVLGNNMLCKMFVGNLNFKGLKDKSPILPVCVHRCATPVRLGNPEQWKGVCTVGQGQISRIFHPHCCSCIITLNMYPAVPPCDCRCAGMAAAQTCTVQRAGVFQGHHGY